MKTNKLISILNNSINEINELYDEIENCESTINDYLNDLKNSKVRIQRVIDKLTTIENENSKPKEIDLEIMSMLFKDYAIWVENANPIINEYIEYHFDFLDKYILNVYLENTNDIKLWLNQLDKLIK